MTKRQQAVKAEKSKKRLDSILPLRYNLNMSIITIANGKGGVGKSTIAINLAGALATKVNTILLIDADPQGTTSDWLKTRQEQQPSHLIHKNLQSTPVPWSLSEITTKLTHQTRKYSFVIIDCGPANDKVTRTALALSNFAIIPVTPSPYDIRSARKTINMLQDGKSSAAITVKPYLLISRKVVGTTLGREAREALGIFNIPILKTEICQRIALCEAGIVGQTIHEYAPSSHATHEFETLGKEVLKWQRQSSLR